MQPWPQECQDVKEGVPVLKWNLLIGAHPEPVTKKLRQGVLKTASLLGLEGKCQ